MWWDSDTYPITFCIEPRRFTVSMRRKFLVDWFCFDKLWIVWIFRNFTIFSIFFHFTKSITKSEKVKLEKSYKPKMESVYPLYRSEFAENWLITFFVIFNFIVLTQPFSKSISHYSSKNLLNVNYKASPADFSMEL